MKHEITSLNTKKLLSASLKKFMIQKPFSKITVTDIVKDCGVNRKTFYYHFQDIQELLKWTLEQETVQVVKQFDLLEESEDAILFVINYVEKNKHILNCAYDAIGRDALKEFFYNDFTQMLQFIIEQLEEELDITVTKEFKIFLCGFYTEALVGKLIELFKSKEAYDTEKLIEYLCITLRTSLPAVLQAEGMHKKN